MLSGAMHSLSVFAPVYLVKELGSSAVIVGVAASLISAGKILSAPCAGSFVSSNGHKASMRVGGCLMVLGFLMQGFTGSLAPPSSPLNITTNQSNADAQYQEWSNFTDRVTKFAQALFISSAFLIGAGMTFYFIAQHTWMTAELIPAQRGMAFASIGGTFRFAGVIFPLLFAAISMRLSLSSVFYLLCVIPFCAVALASLLLPNDESNRLNRSSSESEKFPRTLLLMWRFRKKLGTIGILMLLLMCMRAGREILIPLVGLESNLSLLDISVAVSVSYFCGTAMFPLSGIIMDRYGRKVSAATSIVGLGAGFVILAFSTSSHIFMLGSAVCGLGNGLSSGLVQTFGGDLAPQGSLRGPFLGVYRLVTDCGSLIGPLLAGALTDILSVNAAAWVFVVLGGGCLLWLFVFVSETKPRRPADDADRDDTEISSNPRMARSDAAEDASIEGRFEAVDGVVFSC